MRKTIRTGTPLQGPSPTWLPTWLLAAACAQVLLFATGCAPSIVHMPRPHSPEPHASGDHLRAGMARIDVTPPPGLSLFGHGPEGRVARGHRGRLHCRALYLQDAGDERVALVSCDLAAVSTLLHRAVAQHTAMSSGIGADRLVLSATHTHAGPAHYFGARSYSGLLSTREYGHDPTVLRWLAQRIARAVKEAHDDAQSGGPAEIGWYHGTVGSVLGRNRSMAPHCANAEPMPGVGSSCQQADRSRYLEVDRRLTLLRVDRLDGVDGADGTNAGRRRRLGLYAVYPLHPTAVPNVNVVYHADLFGIAARHAERALGTGDGPVIAALANGHEGDVSPDWSEQGWPEARRLGRLLGDEIVAAYRSLDGKLVPNARVSRAYREALLPGVPVDGDATPNAHLCEEAELGNPAAGGAEDGRTVFYALRPFREGQRDLERPGCHNPRSSLQGKLTSGKWAFPRHAPLHAIDIGGHLLVTLPGEATTTSGLRMLRRLEQERGTDAVREPVTLVGLANGYLQYVTTYREYRIQHYEGASNLYGPWTHSFFEQRLSELVAQLDSASSPPRWLNRVGPIEVRPTPVRRRWPHDRGAIRTRSIIDVEAGLTPRGNGNGSGRGRGRGPRALRHLLRWTDLPPGRIGIAEGALVRVEEQLPDGTFRQLVLDGQPVDDTSDLMEVRLIDSHLAGGRHGYGMRPGAKPPTHPFHWEASWSPTEPPPRPIRFVVLGRGGLGDLISPVLAPQASSKSALSP